MNISTKAGQYFNITHNLNSADLIVDITGKTQTDGAAHQKYFGLTGYIPGWNKTYGEAASDAGYSVVQTSDGGYAVAGFTYSFGAGDADMWLTKTDANGNMQWQKAYGGANYDFAGSVVQTSDGGYALAGWTYSFGAGVADVYLVKANAAGNMQWNQTYGGIAYDAGSSMVQTSDGGYAIVGFTYSFGAGGRDAYLVKTDATGNVQWSQTYGGTGYDQGYSLALTSDGGYVIVGFTESFGVVGDVYLVKTDAAGNMQWQKTYGGTGTDFGYSVVQTNDGGYVIVGFTYSFGAGDADVWLVKADAAGNMQWQRTYGGMGYDQGYSLALTSDGGYAIVGFTYSFGAGDADVWLIETDASGNMQWNKTYGGASYDQGYSVFQMSDGSYTLVGQTFSFGVGGDAWLIKTTVEEELGLAWTDSTANTIALYRGRNDIYWNFVRIRIWKID
jgi:hypothetical protein